MTTQLLIEGYNVELDKSVQFAITKQFEDLSSPADIINDWSKTVSIPFSRNNDKLFGNIYRNDKTVTISEDESIFMYFNPNKKLDFKLLENGNIIMEGYAKMNSIKKNGGKGTYEITLYGNLGKVFGELRDLAVEKSEEGSKYYIGDVIDDNITKDVVKKSWTNTPDLITRDIYAAPTTDIIGFACSNIGFNDNDFVSDSFQNGYDSTIEMKNFVFDGETLETRYKNANVSWDSLMKNGILPRGFSEWRSYYQVPYIYIPRMFELLQLKCKELTDYDLVLDETWFNYQNPYYYNLVMMLQRISSDENINTNEYYISPAPRTNYFKIADITSGKINDYEQDVSIISEDVKVFNGYNNEFNLSDEYSLRLNIPYEFSFEWYKGRLDVGNVKFKNNVTLIIDAVAEYRLNGVLRNDVIKRCTIKPNNYSYQPQYYYETVIRDKKDFTRTYIPSLDKYEYSISFIDTLNFKFDKKDYGNYVKILWKVYFINTPNSPIVLTKNDGSTIDFGSDNDDILYVGVNKNIGEEVKKEQSTDNYNRVTVKLTSDGRSGSNISLGSFWDNNTTFFDEILRYTKTFKLMWDVDVPSKTITILPESVYFNKCVVEDWTDKVDFDKDYQIKPIIFDNKSYNFNYEDNDIQINKEYKKIYGTNYGEILVKTNYAFNNETKDIFENSQLGITSTETVLHWNTVRDMNTASDIVYHQFGEIMPCLHDDDNNPVDTFGQYFFYKGLKTFGGNEDMAITDDTYWQMKNKTYMYIGYDCPEYKTSVNTYPLLDVYYDDKMCLYNLPMKSYCCTSSGEKIVYDGKTGIYENCWKKRFENEVLSLENHILTCYVRLTSIDFENFRFNKFVTVNNQLYIVNKIIDYSPDSTLTKCELIRVNNIENYQDESSLYEGIMTRSKDYFAYGGIYTNIKSIYVYSAFDLNFKIPDGWGYKYEKTITLDNGFELTIEKLDKPFIEFDKQYNYVIEYSTNSYYNDEDELPKDVIISNGITEETLTYIRYSDYPYPPTISTAGSYTGSSGTFYINVRTVEEPIKWEFVNTSRVSLEIVNIQKVEYDGYFYQATVNWKLGTSKIGRTDINVTTMTGYELNATVTFANI